MNRLRSHIRKPVRRSGAEDYLLITLLSFAASVSLTRFFLELTGYPQLGNKELHIAHVLWGGLLLFVASLLPLVLANRWVYLLTSLLSGIGVGLFIDEVGKFITQSNNYFYPPAAPIIYAFFLITVLLYVQIRRPPPPEPRDELYYVLEGLQEVLDHDLDLKEKQDLVDRLRAVARQTSQPDLALLSNELLHFLESKKVTLIQPQTGILDKSFKEIRSIESRLLNPRRLKAVLSGGLLALGILSLIHLFPLILAGHNPAFLEKEISQFVQSGLVRSAASINWYFSRLILESLSGLLMVISAGMLAFGHDRQGLAMGILSLLLSLTAVDLILFYFDQFSTILTAIVQFTCLIGLIYYRRRFHSQDNRSGSV